MQADLRAELKVLTEQQETLAKEQAAGHAEVLREIRRLAAGDSDDYRRTRPRKKASRVRSSGSRSPASYSDVSGTRSSPSYFWPNDGTSAIWAAESLHWPQKLEPLPRLRCQSPARDAGPVPHETLAGALPGGELDVASHYTKFTSRPSPTMNLPPAPDAEAACRGGLTVYQNSKVTSSLLICKLPTASI